MYSMASWSPSQSEPLTVSYMCQRQSSSPMLPSAAAMPPCAATVCERVGKTFVMQAVRSPASAQPTTARRPGPPAPTPTTSTVWSSIGWPRPFTAGAPLDPLPAISHSETQLEDRIGRGEPDDDPERRVRHQGDQLEQVVVHIVDDDLLHADAHVID